MYKKGVYTILSNEPLTGSVWRMILTGDMQWITRPGQFVNVAVEGCYLRRPISVCDWDATTLTLVYKVVGEGTRRMSLMGQGEWLDLLTGLGNGFDIGPCADLCAPASAGAASAHAPRASRRPLLVGGGVGVPPLYALAKALIATGRTPQVVLGFNTASEVFYAGEFRALGCPTHVSTVDGSADERSGTTTRGFATTVVETLKADFDYLYACGPLPMLRALCETTAQDGQLSLEERMGCGFGGCMGCTCQTTDGPKRICKEGPVLTKNEIVW